MPAARPRTSKLRYGVAHLAQLTAAAGWSMAAYVAAACAATCITFTRPVMGSLLPIITHSPRDLVAANVVAGLIEQVGVFAGPLVAGVLMGLWSPTAVFVVAASSSVTVSVTV